MRIERSKNDPGYKPVALSLSPVIFGTSSLGNLFQPLDEATKYSLVSECVRWSEGPLVFDSAGKYGAGLALEVLGRCLNRLSVPPEQVTLSNKLGWLRTELTTEEPTFEPGVWKELTYDAVQKISYDGIIECFEQGNELLGGYSPQMVSVHDPDEYLASARDEPEATQRYEDILRAYQALEHLKQQGKVNAIGVGAKDWTIVRKIANDVPLDWVMLANSITIKTHPPELIDFVQDLKRKAITVINSAVFHSGFLVGGDYFDYQSVSAESLHGQALLRWRAEFFALCQRFEVTPAAACVQFALRVPGVKSVALNATSIPHVRENINLPHVNIPSAFWDALRTAGLINRAYGS